MSYSQLIFPETPYGIWELSGNSPVDLTGRNNATHSGCSFGKKPIIYGLDGSTVLNEESTITISNIYKLFLSGSENKEATIEFFFNIPDSDNDEMELLTIGSFARCYIKSDRIYLEANGTNCNILSETWDKTNYVAIIYKKGSLVLKLNDLVEKAITLGETFIFPDSTAPDIIFGPGTEIPIYLNEIVLYSYAISPEQINKRIELSKFGGNADRIATAISGEIINPQYQSDMEVFSSKISSRDSFESGVYRNIVIEDDYITLQKRLPVSISSGNSEINYTLDINGISFFGESYINLNDISSIFSSTQNVITASLLLDGLSTEQTILEFGPGIDYSSIKLIKSSINKISVIKKSLMGDEEELISSSDLGSDYVSYFNVALIFTYGAIELLVNDLSCGTASISQVTIPLTMYLGNNFNTSLPFTGKIKNFTIDYYDESEPKIFSYGDAGLYTLSLQNTLNVSQKGTWSISYPKIMNSVANTISHNYGSKNSNLIVNGKELFSSSFIPDYDYSNPENINIEAVLKTSDSVSELPILDNIFLIAYETTDVVSSGGKYILSGPPDVDDNPYNNIQPYLLTDIVSNPLDRPMNMGCKFIRNISYLGDILDNPEDGITIEPDKNITSGGRIVINSELSTDNIKIIEFLFKLESIPLENQEFTIFSLNESGGPELSVSSTGLIKSGTYDLYIDGVLTNSISNIDINEFYYIAVVFPTSTSKDIYLGINKNLQNLFNGSISNIVINSTSPSNVQSYVNYRYEAMKGRNKITIYDTDPISLSDDSGTAKTYIISSDGSTFSMNELPKIRIIQDSWESTD